MEDKEISNLIKHNNGLDKWVSKKFFLQFNEAQYQALFRGYHPHWEMRYGIQFEDGYFYNYRSGWIVGKFKVEKIEDDLYHVTEIYDNPEKSDWMVIFESLSEASENNNVQLDIKRLSMMVKKTLRMQKEQ